MEEISASADADTQPGAVETVAHRHTPGPWVGRGRFIGTPNHMSFIAECRDQNGNWSDEPMAVANARLIAAAPDLLDVARQTLRTLLDEAEARDFDPPANTTLVAELEAAIAKATAAPSGLGGGK